MKVKAIKTDIVREDDSLDEVIRKAIPSFPEKGVLVVTSKIISYCQGRLVEKDKCEGKKQKHQLVKQEADVYLPSNYSNYDLMIAIKNNTLTVNAGVDESNADGKYVLWPRNLQKETNHIWSFLRKEYGVKEAGVIITDSRTWPLRWGVVGTCLAHCGFKQLVDFRGATDLFGREINMVQVNVAEALAAAATLEMGEVAEQTPLGIIVDINQIEFQSRAPSSEELKSLKIEVENDVYGPFLTSVEWEQKD